MEFDGPGIVAELPRPPLLVVALLALMLSAIVSPRQKDGASVAPPAMTFAHLCGIGKRDASDADFIGRVDAAMSTMMKAMIVAPSGSADDDFVATMVPHHQGAIDMAKSELLFGTNPNLRRIAQEIVIDQQQEIAAMRYALGRPIASATSFK